MSNVPESIKKIDDFTWEIPTTYKKGMQVPARMIANETLLQNFDAGVFDQITNVACLPGIQKHALCMPDGHWGYGFPIGGVAAFDVNEGVISPGGIGFDINCVSGDTKILLHHGCYKKIKDFDRNFSQDFISLMNLKDNKKHSSQALLFMKKIPTTKVFQITTACGETLTLTEDHPLYTGEDMVCAGKLKEGDAVVIHPFSGVEYEKPSSRIIVDEETIKTIVGDRPKLIQTLRDKNLLPLRENSPHFPILTKLLGFLTGDGWLGKYHNKRRKQDVWSMRAIGAVDDLKEIQKDLALMGYHQKYISTKPYTSVVQTTEGSIRKISGTSSQLYINSQSLVVLLKALGMPEGNKSRTTTTLPSWIKTSPRWIQRLYLAGLFGAEMSKPAQRKGETFAFIEPSFSQNKIISLEKENKKFLLDIAQLLKHFNIKVNNIYKQEGVINVKGETTIKHSLRLSSTLENLITLWGTIGFEYCRERKELSMVALAYLKHKKQFLNHAALFVAAGKSMREEGTTFSEIGNFAMQEGLSQAMVKGALYQETTSRRVSSSFPSFQEFFSQAQIPHSEFVRDTIISIEEVLHPDFVYDFTMNDDNHNFIANSIVSHNCGMRLITTNLSYKEVQPKLKKLVDYLFGTVPAGVGCKGFLQLNNQQFTDIVENGTQWCVDNGYGWQQDVWRTESSGKIEQADASCISDKARKRGMNQLGTLGSGNHYLEIQRAADICDEDTAKRFGITDKDQIVIMVHCGSRGFGHQVATDYLKTFVDAMPKYNITVPDRELACAPFSSDEGQAYFKAMACAANMAFANRQMITHRIREAFKHIFKQTPDQLQMNLVYDVAHNIAKVESHKIDGKQKDLIVHRKGATRAFGPKQKDLAPEYRPVGQPVILGGSMETGSYLLVGTQKAMDTTFGSTAHGSGRTMSRTQAKKEFTGKELQERMAKKGIYVRSISMQGLAEEAGKAYKDIDNVVDVLDHAGITRKVVQLKPIGNVKG